MIEKRLKNIDKKELKANEMGTKDEQYKEQSRKNYIKWNNLQIK